MGSLPNRLLWHFLSGSAVLRPEELIARELAKNKDRLLNGLSCYCKQTQPAGEQLKKEQKLLGQQLDFVQKLARFLGLEEQQCYELFCTYLAYEYRSSKKSLQHIFGSDRHCQALIYKIRDFYFTERLYLLRCLKQVLSFGMDSQHPYKAVYTKFVEDSVSQHKLINSVSSALKTGEAGILDENQLDDLAKYTCPPVLVVDQYESCCDTPIPTWETHGTMMNDRQLAIWARHNLKEQCELLELMVIYFKDFEPDVKRFLTLFEKFKRQGFGQHQTYKHILDETTEALVRRLGDMTYIQHKLQHGTDNAMYMYAFNTAAALADHPTRYLQVLVVLDCLDFELVQKCSQDNSFAGHPILKDKQMFLKLDKLITNMGSSRYHGPLMLGWVVIRQLYMEGDGEAVTKKLGMAALQIDCFSCLSALLSTEPFSGKSIISSVSSYLVYMVLYNMLGIFHEDRLGDSQAVYKVVELTLKQEFVADHVWERGMEDGIGTLYQGALTKFPMEFTPFVQLNIAMASAGQESAKNVLSHLQKLPIYTEYLDRNSNQDLRSAGDSLWCLNRDKYPYGSGGRYSVVIPRDTHGMLYKADKGSPVIQWVCNYNCWNLFMCETDQLLQQLSHGAGMVSISQLNKVTLIMKLIKAMLTSDPASVDQLEGSSSLIFQLIQRCAGLSSPPLDLLSNALDCLTCIAGKHPLKIWHGMKQTGLLPFLTENLDNMAEVLGGHGLQAGQYGSLLAGHECSKGTYPITQAYLSLLCTLVKPLREEQKGEELMASVLFILREVFPVFHKWRYYDKGRREAIGQKSLDLFHRILDFLAEDMKSSTTTSNRPTVQAICVHCLLYTEAGQALLDIVATGVDNIDNALAQQTSTFEGAGIELIQLSQLAFSVLNRLLLLKSPALPMSPVEHALSSQPAGQQHSHIVVTVAQYIYHRHDPRLPTIATLLLKRLAVISPMSILACLGNDAEPIRDMYLMRLQAATEAVRLKVGVLELLTICVQTQPGLTELFLNVQPKSGTDGKKDLSLGKISCLQTVLELLDEKKQGTYQCPPVLLQACMQFIHALWTGLRETAMAVLRSRTSFWPNVMAPLMRDLRDNGQEDNEVVACGMKTSAFVMKIMAQEFYTVPSDKLDKTLHEMLGEVHKKKRLKYWSQCVCEAMRQEGEETTVTMETLEENPTLQLLCAWKNLLITVTTQRIDDLHLDEALKEEILSDIMSGLTAQFSGGLSLLNVKLASVSSALYFTLMKSWSKSIRKLSLTLKEIEQTLIQTCTNSETLIPSVQIGLLGAAAVLVHRIQEEPSLHLSEDVLSSMLVVVCPLVQRSTYQLQCLPSREATQEHGETTSETTAMDVKLKLQVIGLCLLREIIQLVASPAHWLPALQQHAIVSSLLVSVQIWMKAKQGVQYVQSVILLFITIAASEKGAECLCLGGLTEHTCLAVSSLYKNEDLVSEPSNLNHNKQSSGGVTVEETTWSGMYCLCLDLYTTMLSTLRYSFLKDALDFVGVHQDRLQQVLEVSRVALHEKVWREAKKTCSFVHQLSHFSRDWRLQLPDVMAKLLTSMSYMCQTFISLLVRPTYLQHLLEHQSGGANGRGGVKGQDLSGPLPPLLQTQASNEDLDNPSSQFGPVQQCMLDILGRSLSTLRQFTPDLCEVLLDQSLDISEYDPFLVVGFSTPSMEQSTPPSFGTLLACVTVCVRMLTKMEPKVTSPHRSPLDATQPAAMSPPKTQVQFVLESCLYIVLSQACRYLKEPSLPPRDKQLLKRELGTELNYFLTSYHRYLKRGSSPSPGGTHLTSPGGAGTVPSRSGASISRSLSTTTFTMAQDQAFCKLVQEFVTKVLR